MTKLSHRSSNVAGAKPEIDNLTPNERTMLLEFMLYHMEHGVREKIMVNHPRIYNVLFPGTLKIRISTVEKDGVESRVVCED